MTLDVRVNLGPRSYDIAIAHEDLRRRRAVRAGYNGGPLALVVTDEALGPRRDRRYFVAQVGFRKRTVVLTVGESTKLVSTTESSTITWPRCRRSAALCCSRGGFIGDVAVSPRRIQPRLAMSRCRPPCSPWWTARSAAGGR